MKLLIGLDSHSQVNSNLQLTNTNHWKMDHNKWITGSLVFIAGTCKGFNETLQFHWPRFQRTFPNANPWWFNPKQSWKNKYENRDSSQGPSLLKIGEGKRAFKQYLLISYYPFIKSVGD